MPIAKLLVANRGEIAARVMRSAAELGIETVAVYAEDDASCLHVRKADAAQPLAGSGPAAYLDVDGIVEAATRTGCDALHPGYGFLSESEALARACDKRDICFVGPAPEALALFGDKLAARRAAARADVPVLAASDGPVDMAGARDFRAGLDGRPMLIKAVAGGGGRGMRRVEASDALEDAFERCASEANAAFGDAALYVEELMPRARHVEVQIAGDREGRVIHLGERDCSIQRRHQKVVEIAPAPELPQPLRECIAAAAVRIAEQASYGNVGTFEFLVDADADADGDGDGSEARFAFIEANPRLQVEHTVTEAVTGVDLVELQLELAGGRTLAALGLDASRLPPPRAFAIQLRINMERMAADGTALPTGGRLAAFEPPSGPGIRTDTLGYAGYATSPRYDSLLAKLIAFKEGRFEDAVARAYRALCEFRIEGVETNVAFLQNLLRHPSFKDGQCQTGFVDTHIAELAGTDEVHRRLYFSGDGPAERSEKHGRAGAEVDRDDPLAVLSYGQQASRERREADTTRAAPEGMQPVEAPLQGTVVAIEVTEGDAVQAGQRLLVMESMKMEHEVAASTAGIVRAIRVVVDDAVVAGHVLLELEESAVNVTDTAAARELDPDAIRPDLEEVLERRAATRDEARPQAVERRRVKGQRTARENVEDLCDPGTFVEYGSLTLAAQRRRRSLEELIEKSPADGMVTGVGAVNGELFGDPAARCAVLAYDYTVFAGTQGAQNHRKTDRLIDVAEHGRLPLMLFAEGGGGRPGDTDTTGSGQRTFARFPQLSGLVPMVGIVAGRCFAGNASLAGCCDVIIATRDANLGMGGPAMIEGGGLGVFAPEDIGPMTVQDANGVVDVLVDDEAEAVRVARRYVGYFQGDLGAWEAPDQRLMRHLVPENRLRVYDVRKVIATLADTDSELELRPRFGVGMLTAFARVEGRPLGIIANNPTHLGGAIDADGADKAARFMQLCDAFDIPILYLCDTPGIMVGPEVEKTALVRHSSRMFLIGCNLSVPFFTVVLRKSYGLGGIAMAGGSYKFPSFTISWPTGEFGGMGLEGQVKLGYRDELAAIEDPEERKRRYEEMVARAYENGKALNQASLFQVDETVDPAETRWWVASLLASIRSGPPRTGKKRAAIDGW